MSEPCEDCPYLPSNTYSTDSRKKKLLRHARSGKLRVCHQTGHNAKNKTELLPGEIECAGAKLAREQRSKTSEG